MGVANKIPMVVTCRLCKEDNHLSVDQAGYAKWQNREAYIQDALPELDANERELLISQTCGTCWDNMWGDEE